jgi:hypothetical protein
MAWSTASIRQKASRLSRSSGTLLGTPDSQRTREALDKLAEDGAND